MKKFFSIASTVLIVAVMIPAICLFGPRLLGYTPYYVYSGSMEPTYPVGSVVYVKPVAPLALHEGDVITFYSGTTVVTHRIVEMDASDVSNPVFTTKGDANDAPDGAKVAAGAIIGSPKFSLPYLGYLAKYLQTPTGKYVAIAGCALIVLLVFLPSLFPDKRKEVAGGRCTPSSIRE